MIHRYEHITDKTKPNTPNTNIKLEINKDITFSLDILNKFQIKVFF